MTIEHKNITDAETHEPKGASTATDGQVMTSNGDTTTGWQTPMSMGWWNFDEGTGTAIPLTVAATDYTLTNDTLGVNTITTYAHPDVTQIWDSSTNRLDFTELDIGDVVDIRVDVDYTTTGSNTALEMDVEFAVGTGSEFKLPFLNNFNVKSSSTGQVVVPMPLFIGSALVRDNPARLVMSSDSTGSSISVNGWWIRVIKRQED